MALIKQSGRRTGEHLALYLAVNIAPADLAELGLTEVVHTRIASAGARPCVTTK